MGDGSACATVIKRALADDESSQLSDLFSRRVVQKLVSHGIRTVLPVVFFESGLAARPFKDCSINAFEMTHSTYTTSTSHHSAKRSEVGLHLGVSNGGHLSLLKLSQLHEIVRSIVVAHLGGGKFFDSVCLQSEFWVHQPAPLPFIGVHLRFGAVQPMAVDNDAVALNKHVLSRLF